MPEPPVSTYSQEMIENAKNFSDTAAVVIFLSEGGGPDEWTLGWRQGKNEEKTTPS